MYLRSFCSCFFWRIAGNSGKLYKPDWMLLQSELFKGSAGWKTGERNIS